VIDAGFKCRNGQTIFPAARDKKMGNTKLFQTLLFSLILEAGLTMAAPVDESLKKLDHNPAATAIEGSRYETTTPANTLDLADRMSMAINALTQAWFPEEKWALGFKVDFSRRPPALSINHATDAYLNIPPKFIEALALCRLGSGSNQNIDVDKNILEAQLRFFGIDAWAGVVFMVLFIERIVGCIC